MPNSVERDREIMLKEFLKFVKNLNAELNRDQLRKTKLRVFRKWATYEM